VDLIATIITDFPTTLLATAMWVGVLCIGMYHAKQVKSGSLTTRNGVFNVSQHPKQFRRWASGGFVLVGILALAALALSIRAFISEW